MNSIKMKPCPFCSGRPKVDSATGYFDGKRYIGSLFYVLV